jgi:hypothetical protein
MSHADTRTTRQKLEAMAALGSGATDGERDNALAALAALDLREKSGSVPAGGTKSGRILTRAAILATPARTTPVRTLSYRDQYGYLVTIDLEDWD